MARNKFSSPRLELSITPDQWAEAMQSASGGCLIADAIKRQYPQFTGITVDMATVRVSDRKAGMRYIYLTPGPAQHLLLAFDQGWSQATEAIRLHRAVTVSPIQSSAATEARRAARLAELEEKETAGTLTTRERAGLTNMRNRPPRAKSAPKAEVLVPSNGSEVVVSGRAPKQGEAHPNLLRGRDRHFGAKLADPGQAFQEAVEEAVARRLAEVGEPAPIQS